MNKLNVLSIPVSTGPYRQFVDTIATAAMERKGGYVCVANVHMLVEAHQCRNFAAVVRNASVITPDGKPLAWALRLLYGVKQDRVAGVDLMHDLLTEATKKNIGVFFYGGTPEILSQATHYLTQHYAGLTIGGMYSPPFRLPTKEEAQADVDRINDSGSGLVFVALGCPKQERWMAGAQGHLKAVAVGIGAALPVMIGVHRRAPEWVRNWGLEWAFRLLLEPRRLFRRYAVTNTLFLFLLTKTYLRKKILTHKLTS